MIYKKIIFFNNILKKINILKWVVQFKKKRIAKNMHKIRKK